LGEAINAVGLLRSHISGHLEGIEVADASVIPKGKRIGSVGYTGDAQALKIAGLPPHLHFGVIRARKNGLADRDQPLRRMKDWTDYWQEDFGAENVGPINPGLLMGSACWTGSTSVGAPGER
jgi:murein DD-endopeptidase MepM/ murein hydrolase activator NlpD